jgi:hypothetical protein
VAGLAKGEHQDHDDFYVRVKRENDKGDPDRWLPTNGDHRLLKQEVAAVPQRYGGLSCVMTM